MKHKKLPIETKGRGQEDAFLKVRINGKPTTITVPKSVRDEYWPLYKTIAKVHFGKSASQLLTDHIMTTVREHTSNPQSTLQQFVSHPGIPALPTIGRGAKVKWEEFDNKVLAKVFHDAQQVLKDVSIIMHEREGEPVTKKPSQLAILWDHAEKTSPETPLLTFISLVKQFEKSPRYQKEKEVSQHE